MKETRESEMDCQVAQELLVDLLYGELAPDVRKDLEAHLDKCPECSSEYEQMAGVLKLVRANPLDDLSTEPPAELSERILHAAQVAARQRSQRQKPMPWWKWWIMNPALSGAVVLLLVVTVGLITLSPDHEPTKKSSSVQAISTESLPAKDYTEELDRRTPKALPEKKAPDVVSSIEHKALVQDESGKAGIGQVSSDDRGIFGLKTAAKKKRKSQPRGLKTRQQAQLANKTAGIKSQKAKTSIGGGGGNTGAMGRSEYGFAQKEHIFPKRKAPGPKTLAKRSRRTSTPSSDAPAYHEKTTKPLDDLKTADKAKPTEVQKPSTSTMGKLEYRSEQAPAAGGLLKKPAVREKPMSQAGASKSGEHDMDMAGSSPAGVPVAASSEPLEEKPAAERAGRDKEDESRSIQEHEDQSSSASSLYLAAKDLFRSGYCKAAIKAIDRALRKYPRHRMAPDALFDKASCLVKLGEFSKAIKTYQRIENNYPARAKEARRQIERIAP